MNNLQIYAMNIWNKINGKRYACDIHSGNGFNRVVQ